MTQRSSKRRPKSEIVTVTKDEDALIRGLVIHEDDALLVFNKPSGLAVQGGSGVVQDVDRLLWAFATRKGRRPKLVHRLDRQTSGVLVVAKTAPSAAHLSQQFAARTTIKVYQALCCGVPSEQEGVIDTPLLRYVAHGIDLVRVARDGETNAQSASTAWRRAADYGPAALLEALPHTGRMHQIRAHLASIGCPIAGDEKYGGLFAIGGVMVPRLMLHATSLSVIHPTNGENVTFTADLPDDFVQVLARLGKI